MADLSMALAANLSAVSDFMTCTDALGAVWTTAPAPGKWSAAQLAEHIALTYDMSCRLMRGENIGLRPIPRLLRPLLRRFVIRKILETGNFGRPSRTFKPFEPVNPSATPPAARLRLERSVEVFEQQVRASTPIGDYTFVHPAFGKMHVTDYVRLQLVHTRHHLKQLPRPSI